MNDKIAFQLAVLSGVPLEVSTFQKELELHLNEFILKKKQIKKEAQKTLEKESLVARNNIEKDISMLSNSKDKEAINSIRHKYGDVPIKNYEEEQKKSGIYKYEAYQAITTFISHYPIRWQLFVEGIEGYSGKGSIADEWKILWVDEKNRTNKHLIMTIWFGSKRFMTKDISGIYIHRTNSREYVLDRHDIPIARYVIRNLSASDDPLKNDPALKAQKQALASMSLTDLRKEVMAHVRSKESTEAGTCFLSFTHTKNKIYGSTAKEFYDPKNGDMIIDMSLISKDHRIDLHSDQAIAQIFEISYTRTGLDWNEHSKNTEKYDYYQRNAAARDTVRTREILVLNEVPCSAVVAVRHPQKTKGQWQTLKGFEATLPKEIPAAWK